jgi:hypothetical protein
MAAALTHGNVLWPPEAQHGLNFGGGGALAQKWAENRKTCGKKDTASLPRCGTSI